jgi:beta-lactamase class C
MVNFINRFLLAALCIPFFAQANDKEAAIEHTIAALEQNIVNNMKAQGIPGVAVAVVTKDKVYFVKGFGVRKVGSKEKVTPNTLFQIASLSKPINATMVAILQQKGKLSLHDPVQKHIPHFKCQPKNQTLRICHLISHSSGIPNNGFNEQIEAFIPKEKIVARLQKTKAVSAPGKRFVYNNAMYGMVEDVITSASGKKLDATLRDELFKPLGMKHACVGLTSLLSASDKAYPHIPGRGKYVPAEKYSTAYYGFPSAGGLNASVEDLIPFLQMYLGKPSPILSKEVLKGLTEPYVKNTNPVINYLAKKGVIANNYYAMGWNTMTFANKRVVYHQGHVKGFRNFMGFIDGDIGIIILTNAERKHSTKFAVNFFETYLKNSKST